MSASLVRRQLDARPWRYGSPVIPMRDCMRRIAVSSIAAPMHASRRAGADSPTGAVTSPIPPAAFALDPAKTVIEEVAGTSHYDLYGLQTGSTDYGRQSSVDEWFDSMLHPNQVAQPYCHAP